MCARTGEWPRNVVAAAVAALEPLADPARAAPMAAYMRNQFPFLGVGTPVRTAALRKAWRGLPAPSSAELAGAATALWNLREREYQYAACDLLGRSDAPPAPTTMPPCWAAPTPPPVPSRAGRTP